MAETTDPPQAEDGQAGNRFLKGPHVRKVVKVALDTFVACLGFVVASSVLLQGVNFGRGMVAFVLIAMFINLGLRFHTQHYRAMDIHDARWLVLGTATLAGTNMTLCLVRGGWTDNVRPDVVLGASLITGILWVVVRMAALAIHQRRHSHPSVVPGGMLAERTLIIGAGRAGVLLCQELREHPRLRCNVLGFIDDDLEKQGLRILGIPVLGPTTLLPLIIREQNVSQVILGMAGVRGARLRELSKIVMTEGIKLKTVPGIMDLVGDRPWKPEVRDIAIEDLLRRDPITLDTEAIRKALDNQVVLITGAGGSIGSELARRVADIHPGKLVLLGRGENSLWEVQRQLVNLFPNQEVEIALCDIRNPARLHQVFEKWRPRVVLHAAAHKHVPFLEANPEEAIENNIFGTRNVIEAAKACGTRIFVNVSTDKAVNPVNMLGASKAVGELLVARAAIECPGSKFVSVRFGNVLGSRGSVIPLFRDQIRGGGPVTITHPDMVRYFMTIPEAAQLVLQAGILGDTGKVFALDMGEPVHIVNLAEEMVRLSGFSPGVDVDIRFTGVRPGEKLVEELFTEGRVSRTTVHPKVFEAKEFPVDPERLREGLAVLREILDGEGETCYPKMLRCFMELIPTFQPSPHGLGRYLDAEATPVNGKIVAPAAPIDFRSPETLGLRAYI
ncbi:nucleoside-diphosphate sugar epimerase/dehydratase [Geothrix sp. 21YS21S-2]|uniref:polysaccharide biosynthesis protein n=1 Tax=Geothrix sp. 21YS21S-2 TaxID=3068893 RepID=UPI0027B8EA3D|nr:nucleoside-diphosphate sugar epimerase/dehydratase [Geothrix sp. 21YS21S-2]